MHPKIRANIEMQISTLESHLWVAEILRDDPSWREPDVQAAIDEIARQRGLSEVAAANLLIDWTIGFKQEQIQELRQKLDAADNREP